MKKVILIHGYTSSPRKKKYQIISNELDNLGIDYSIPAMPGGTNPKAKEWLEVIDSEVKKTAKPLVLVGHSLGTRAIILYLDRYEREVDTVILISAFDNNIKNKKLEENNIVGFFDYPVDIGKIRKLVNKIIVVHSIDDDSIDYEQGKRIGSQLKAQLITYKKMGHFCGEENAERNAKCFLKVIKSVI